MANDFSAGIQSSLVALQADAQALARVAESAHGEAGGAQGASFMQSMNEAFHRVNEQDVAAGRLMADVDAGRSDDLVGAMLASQQASLSFSMLMQVRNKVMGAVEDLVKLPL